MNGGTPGSGAPRRLRLFLALDPSERVRRRLDDVQGELRRGGATGWKWIRPEAIHLTVLFLGWVDPALDERARDAWRDVAARTPRLDLVVGGLGRFPAAGRPRVLWAGIDEPARTGALERLATAASDAARDLGFAIEARSFSPHLTLARAERRTRPHLPAGARFEPGEPLTLDALRLMRSQLGPTGARYTVLESFPLGREPTKEL